MALCRASVVVMAAVFTVAIAHAQDTRDVREPVIPPPCVVLTAHLHGDNGIIASDDADHGDVANPDLFPSNAALDTERIQVAMDTCPQGHAVELETYPAHNRFTGQDVANAFVSGPLKLRAGVILLVDKGVTLYASRNPADFETSPDSCAKVNNERNGCKPFITAVNANGTGIMGDGVIDGRGGAKVIGKDMSWWEIAATSVGGTTPQQVPQLLTTNHADNFILYKITLKNAPHFHFVPANSNGITMWGVKIDTPDHTPNTDGFDPGGGTKNITVIYSYIRDGDDDIVPKGSTGGVTNMSVLHTHIYSGHGMSIGGETYGGVSHLLVRDLSLDGTDNGIRIKSNPTSGGLVDDVQYDDVCIRNSRNPIILTTSYAWPGGMAGELPVYKNVVLRNVRVYGGGRITLDGVDATHRIGVQFDGVMLMDGPSKYKLAAFKHADVKLGPGPVNLPLSGGEDTTVNGKPGKGKLAGCSDKFVPFPVTQ